MTGISIGRQVRGVKLGEWLALAAAIALFAYLGWDGAMWDARFQFALHLIAIGAFGGLVVIALRGGLLPRTRIDLPILALLAAFALATVSAVNVGMSLRAMAAIIATAGVLPAALLAIRHRPSWLGVVTSVPVLVISVVALVHMLERRVDWLESGIPGLPPIRVASEGTPFGSVAVAPFVIWPAWALAGLIGSARWRTAIRTALVLVGVPLTILSGSRSAWLAVVITGLMLAATWVWERRGRLKGMRLDARTLLGTTVALAGVGVLAVLLWPRITAAGSIVTRFNLWRDTIAAWSSDPLLGIGPGFMPFARQAAAADHSFPVRQPHSHNIPLGILGDAGIVGLVAAAAVLAAIAWFAGPWRARTPVGRTAGYLLVALGVAGFFEDLTFLPNFNVLALALLAVALTDAGAVSWSPIRRGRLQLAAGAASALAGVVLVAAMVVSDAGALAYREGIEASVRRTWPRAAERFARSVEIDRWHPAGPKALAVAADAAGLTRLARDAAERATQLNPGDAPSWTNLALLCAELGERECHAHATERAVATTERIVPNTLDRTVDLLNAAYSFEALGRHDDADDAYRRSLLTQRLTAFATRWPRTIPIGEAAVPELGTLLEFNRLIAKWEMGETIDPGAIRDPATRALALAMLGERDDAEASLRTAIGRRPDDPRTWDVAVVLREYWGVPLDETLAMASAARGGGYPRDSGTSGRPLLTYDIGSFRSYPGDGYVTGARRLVVRPPYPWVLRQMLEPDGAGRP